jgi:nucleotide-binding universal stress UspA family protein
MARELRRLLIAVEDGTSDEQVVESGIDLAVDEGAEVIFVHVVSIAGESFVPTDDVARVPEGAASDVLIEACERAEARGLKATSELLIGYPARQIALLADERDADLIVIGSRRLSALKRAVLGSTSHALLSESNRRVLVVPLTADLPAHPALVV